MPKRSIARAATKDRLAAIIEKQMPARDRVALAVQLAKGVSTIKLVKGKDGADAQEVVFKTAPSLEAIRFLEEYATGKPVQTQQLSNDTGFACIIVPPVAASVDVARLRELRAREAKK